MIYPEQVHSPSSWANHLHSSPSCHLFISIIIVLLHMVWKCSLIYFFNMASFLQIQTGTCIMACSDGVWLPLPQTFNIICSTYTTYVYIWKNILMATTGKHSSNLWELVNSLKIFEILVSFCFKRLFLLTVSPIADYPFRTIYTKHGCPPHRCGVSMRMPAIYKVNCVGANVIVSNRLST